MGAVPFEAPGLTDLPSAEVFSAPQLTLIEGGLGAEGAAAAGVIPGVAIVLMGAKLDQVLLTNDKWNGLWSSAGAKIDDAWNGVYHWLNPPKSPNREQIKAMIEHRAALQAEHARAISTAHTAVELAIANVVHAEHSARIGMQNVAGERIRLTYVQAVQHADVNLVKAISHANALDARRAKINLTQLSQLSKADRQYVTDHVAKPLQTQALRTQAQLDNLQENLGKLITTAVAGAVATQLGPIMKTLQSINARLQPLEDEATDCVQPMCEMIGPKTDLSKFLKGIKVAKWLAILAALETIDVKTLEHLALEVAGTEGKIGEWVASAVLGELEAEHG